MENEIKALNVLIVGSTGSLGKAVLKTFSAHRLLSVERNNQNAYFNLENRLDDEAYENLKTKLIKDKIELDAIVCVAGQWEGKSISSDKLFSSIDSMMQSNFYTAALCCRLASELLVKGGMVVLTGSSKVFKEVCPGCLLIRHAHLPINQDSLSHTCTHTERPTAQESHGGHNSTVFD